MIGLFHYRFDEFKRLLGDDKVDFIFDDKIEKRMIRARWDAYVNSRPPVIRARFGASPRFEDDKKFLPLQGADLVAGWSRYCLDSNREISFSELSSRRSISPVSKTDFVWQIVLHRTEDEIPEYLLDAARRSAPNDTVVWDIKHPNR